MKYNSRNNFSKNVDKRNKKKYFDDNSSKIKNRNSYVYKANQDSKLKNNFEEKSSNNIYKKNSNKQSKINKNKEIFQKNHRNKTGERNNEDLIWGKHSVFSALESGKPINRIWCTPEVRSSEKFFLLLKEVKSKGVLVEEVSWSRISQITFGAVHQGIALQISYRETISLKTLIKNAKIKSNCSTIICLDGITDPHNVGAIIRSAEAFGCNGIIIPQRRSAGITGTVAKVSAGALDNILVSRVVNLNRTLHELKEEGFLIVGLTEKGNLSLSKFKEKSPLVIVVGSEDKGLSLLTQKYCDYLLKIPLIGKTSSLNASVAAAISIYQLRKEIYS